MHNPGKLVGSIHTLLETNIAKEIEFHYYRLAAFFAIGDGNGGAASGSAQPRTMMQGVAIADNAKGGHTSAAIMSAPTIKSCCCSIDQFDNSKTQRARVSRGNLNHKLQTSNFELQTGLQPANLKLREFQELLISSMQHVTDGLSHSLRELLLHQTENWKHFANSSLSSAQAQVRGDACPAGLCAESLP